MFNNTNETYINFIDKINELSLKKNNLIIAIDGNCGAGKTTLANMLKENYNCNVIAMDNFFLRPKQRTKQRLEEIGGHIDYERFEQEILNNLNSTNIFFYRPFLCKTQNFGEKIAVDNKKMRIVEGSYSMHPKFAHIYDIKVFVSLPYEEQLKRIEIRNGKEKLLDFKEIYIPNENAYFNEFDIKNKCDYIF